MALFALYSLIRLRETIYGCPHCKRIERKLALRRILTAPPPPIVRDPESGVVLEEIELQSLTRNIAVQTDFDDGPEDLDKIELVGEEESSYNASTTCSIECEREIQAILLNNNRIRRNIAHLKTTPDSESNDSIWESLEVILERGANGLGLYIAGGNTGSDVSISRIDNIGPAKTNGKLRIGDILERVNDISVENGPHSFAVDALQRAGHFVKLRVRRPRRLLIVTLYRGACGLGLGIAGGTDNGVGGIFISQIYRGSSAHYDGRIKVGDKILAVRNENNAEISLIGSTHAHAVSVLGSAGDTVTLVVLPAAFIAPLNRPTLQRTTHSQATSCSTLDKILEEPEDIPRCVRMVKLVRSSSRIGLNIIGGLGGDGPPGSADEPCGVFVSKIMVGGSADGLLYQGDKILSVDGKDLTRATHRQAAFALKFAGDTITIAAQYQPDQFKNVRAKINAIHAAQKSPLFHPQSAVVQVHISADSNKYDKVIDQKLFSFMHEYYLPVLASSGCFSHPEYINVISKVGCKISTWTQKFACKKTQNIL